MKQKNILQAITSAISHLEISMEDLARSDEKKVTYHTWRAESEVEYALFLFSLMHHDKAESSSWRLNLHSKQVEIAPLLVLAKDLLGESKHSFQVDEVHEAHKKTWLARGHLLRVHDFFEKKRRNREKVSSSKPTGLA